MLDPLSAEEELGEGNDGKKTEHKRHKKEHRRHKNRLRNVTSCAFCVLFVPFVFRSRSCRAARRINMNTPSHPPTFSEARNSRQKARAAGLNPDYWYAVEHDKALKRGGVVEITFWKNSIALYRDYEGNLHALENRCAHRQLKLSHGEVNKCNLVCAYHGWAYDGTGRVTEIPHDLFGRQMPSFKIKSFPTRVRYGLI